jgi:hypothetical protein
LTGRQALGQLNWHSALWWQECDTNTQVALSTALLETDQV